ncbi:Thioredoxin-like protein [Colletotrichum orbiculare MAFF 240422]|uniref:Thioredoxin-like protein n=1 Tax=Colletotrichum orbiculare (strain 104-T / ATCC 96160 / CBS 514.97 / LARS 414 / MAFF 240422) TaxID=1213857 RepID=A0A484F7J0_COLOR|nr:Thioredoxin-like protein [Colletotrichum orbiculare MAFF 240422]
METTTYILLAVAIFIIGKAKTSGKVYKVASPGELDAVLASNAHVVVDFYADWCPPCRAIAPVFSGLADKHASEGKLAFAKVNVDHVNAVAGRYKVTAMPTFVFFRNGKPEGVKVEGVTPRQSVSFTGDGLVDRVRGADRAALQAVVQALAEQSGGNTKQ